MVSKKLLKELEFNSIQEYYEYIVTSQVNGQFDQVNNLISELTKIQKKDAIDYINCLTDPYEEGLFVESCNKVIYKIFQEI